MVINVWEYSLPGQLTILDVHIRILLVARGFIVSEFASKSDSRQTFKESSGVMSRQESTEGVRPVIINLLCDNCNYKTGESPCWYCGEMNRPEIFLRSLLGCDFHRPKHGHTAKTA